MPYSSAKPVFCVQEPIDTIYGHRCHRFHRVSQDGLEWDSSCDSIRVHTMTSTELHRLDSRMSDPSGNFAKLTCTGPKLNTYRALFSTCQLIVSSFATTTSNFIDLISMANSQIFSGKFIVSHLSPWHKHSCALFLTFIPQDPRISVSYSYKYSIVFQAFWTHDTSGKQR